MNGVRGRRPLIVVFGVILFAVSSAAVFHGSRAATAYAVYHHTRYGAAGNYDARQCAVRCDTAHKLYPFNYYFCIWTAERCWYERFDAAGDESFRHVELAGKWCDRGLELNRRKSQLRLLKTRLLARESLEKALSNWEDYVDWHFWCPHNHAVLVDYYSMAGNYEKAVKSLKLLRDTGYYDSARRKVREAWSKEMRMQ